MEKRVDAGLLLSFYGAMLTGRQRETLRLYYEDDLSLSEIAQLTGVTRQGAHDAVRRGEMQLLALEEKLGLKARWVKVSRGLADVAAALDRNDIAAARETVAALLKEEEDRDGV